MTSNQTGHRGPDRSERGPGRVPPHNLDAEMSALGAAFLNRPAAEHVAGEIRPADYYRPQHRMIAEAVAALVADEKPVDVVTVGEILRRNGTLEDAGGMQYLADLQNATPAISAVATYCEAIARTAQQRRMIYAAGDLAESAYNETDPAEALAKHQSSIDELAAGKAGELVSTIDVADIAALLATDLSPELGTYLLRTDGAALLYAGKMHVFQAEPSSGKSWIALLAVAEVLELGGSAVYIDYEDTPAGILGRLRALGAEHEALATRLRYLRPVGKHGPAERLHLRHILDEVNPDLVIIDGVGESLSRNGFSENEADDVLRWTDAIPRPICATGAAVVMLDHVAKDPESRGRWQRGSGAKLGVVDGASYQVKVVAPFARKRAGAIKLVIAKDRPGGIGAVGETAAIVKIEPHGDGELVRMSVEPDGSTLELGERFKPTQTMAAISREIEAANVPPTAKALEALLSHAKPKTVHEALARLIAEGYVTETKAGRSKTLKLVKPYHGATDREPPPPDPDDPPDTLPGLEPAEPAWMAEAAREALDVFSTDPQF